MILSLPFAVLRTIDYSKAGFDALKTTAITQYGAGKNAKLNMQFNSRIWNNTVSDGSLYTDLPVQSGWEVSRGQSGTQGLWVAYPGANVASSWGQSTPYSTAATNNNVTKIAGQARSPLARCRSGIRGGYRASPGPGRLAGGVARRDGCARSSPAPLSRRPRP